MPPAQLFRTVLCALAAFVASAVGARAQVLLGSDPLALVRAVFQEAPAPADDLPAGVELGAATFEAAARLSEDAAGRALLVVRDGEVLFERYTNGWSAERPHALASGTKSFSGVLAVAAIEDGLIAGLDSLASDVLTEWKTDPKKNTITVRQLLDLSSGLAPNHDSLGRQGFGIVDLGPVNALAQRLRRKEAPPADRFAAAVALPLERDPGEQFAYGAGHFYAFGALLQRALENGVDGERVVAERNVFDYLSRRVLVPAGIHVDIERFAPDAAQRPNLPGGGHLTAREWASFGTWVLRGGAHVGADGERVYTLEPGALAPLFEPSACNACYGLTWWLLNGAEGSTPDVADDGGLFPRPSAGTTEQIFDAAGEPIEIVMAAGAGKQRLYLVPSLDLVVVRFAEMRVSGRSYDDAEFLRTLLGLAKVEPRTR